MIDHYDRGGGAAADVGLEIAPLHLTALEKSDLEAFLRALSSPILGPAPAPPAPRPATPTLLERARSAPNARALRIEAAERLEQTPLDADALAALLVASARLGEANLLDDAIERARGAWSSDRALGREGGVALVRRARLEDPVDRARLTEAAGLLRAADGPDARPGATLELAYALHLLGDAAGAVPAYERLLDCPDEDLAERAFAGRSSLLRLPDVSSTQALAALSARFPASAVVLRRRAEAAAAGDGAAAAIALLEHEPATIAASPRAAVLLARLLRDVERHAEATSLERAALARAPFDRPTLVAIEALWREHRPLASFGDCDALDRDFEALFAAVRGDAWLEVAWRNDLAFRLREVVSTYAWRGEARTQGLARGAPADAGRLLARCVELYEQAVAAIPGDVADRPLPERWAYAAILNDAALMRHYWLDVRDLAKAEATYLRAFELTDGAYMDTYFYNLQYLYGFELPGNEEKWYGLARRASERILKESPEGLVPDERKRDAARGDAEALAKVLKARSRAQPPK